MLGLWPTSVMVRVGCSRLETQVGSKGQVLPGAARLHAAFGGCSLPPLLSGHTFMREMEFQW